MGLWFYPYLPPFPDINIIMVLSSMKITCYVTHRLLFQNVIENIVKLCRNMHLISKQLLSYHILIKYYLLCNALSLNKNIIKDILNNSASNF